MNYEWERANASNMKEKEDAYSCEYWINERSEKKAYTRKLYDLKCAYQSKSE